MAPTPSQLTRILFAKVPSGHYKCWLCNKTRKLAASGATLNAHILIEYYADIRAWGDIRARKLDTRSHNLLGDSYISVDTLSLASSYQHIDCLFLLRRKDRFRPRTSWIGIRQRGSQGCRLQATARTTTGSTAGTTDTWRFAMDVARTGSVGALTVDSKERSNAVVAILPVSLLTVLVVGANTLPDLTPAVAGSKRNFCCRLGGEG
ncbi:hypothetical protein PC110_g9715 [Phytophthora cactorum]|uniref:Uncharacterized protein n=2 Tax=Phytophthora cactorum TaxID=29920 RepID=A0A329SEK7_9STRA|nr:hypothetical protein PC110_g9715 [Phytophthora cactorum]